MSTVSRRPAGGDAFLAEIDVHTRFVLAFGRRGRIEIAGVLITIVVGLTIYISVGIPLE